MESGYFRRRTIALIAAYAMALQQLFAAFVPGAPALLASPFAALCSHDAGGPGLPAQHDQPCAALCAAMAHGIAGPVPPDVAAAIAVLRPGGTVAQSNEWVPPQIALTDIHAPRGPPLA